MPKKRDAGKSNGTPAAAVVPEEILPLPPPKRMAPEAPEPDEEVRPSRRRKRNRFKWDELANKNNRHVLAIAVVFFLLALAFVVLAGLQYLKETSDPRRGGLF